MLCQQRRRLIQVSFKVMRHNLQGHRASAYPDVSRCEWLAESWRRFYLCCWTLIPSAAFTGVWSRELSVRDRQGSWGK